MTRRKIALAAGAGVLTAALLGGAALAAFAPVADEPTAQVGAEGGIVAPADNKGGDKLKAILDGLVAKGVITQAQEDAIVAALRDAAPKRDAGDLKRVFASLLEDSAKYLGLGMADLKTKLPGTSLAAIADSTAGKSRTGLVATLQTAVNAAIDTAQSANKITKEQADRAKAEAPARIAAFVDHVYPKRPAVAPKTPAGTRIAAFLGDALATSRDYLGLSQTDLMTAVRDGKSLGEIANATPGKSRDGLIAQLTTAANAKIDKATTDGKLTAEQATALKAQVGPAVTAFVDRKGTALPKR